MVLHIHFVGRCAVFYVKKYYQCTIPVKLEPFEIFLDVV